MLKIYAGRRELKLREGKSTVETDVSPQTDWGSSCTVQVYSYKCIVVTLELWRFQLGSKITLLEMHSFYKLFIESKRNICKMLKNRKRNLYTRGVAGGGRGNLAYQLTLFKPGKP